MSEDFAASKLARPRWWPWLWVFITLAVVISLLPWVRNYTEGQNLALEQAKAFLQGRLDLPGYFSDVAVKGGRYYVPFPPFPAVLLLPLAALGAWKPAYVIVVSLALTLLNLVVLPRLLRSAGASRRSVYWLQAAFFLGTAYWMCVIRSSGVWFFDHVVAVSCLLLALSEALGKGRGLLVGLFLGLAFLCRQMTIFSALFLVAALWENAGHPQPRRKLLHLAGFATVLLVCIGGYLWFNAARFGSAFDTGYAYIQLTGFLAPRVERFGLFHPVYLPFNFINMFLQGFHVTFEGSRYLWGPTMDSFGTSLTFASPFVFVAFLARWKKSLLWAGWLSVALTLVAGLFYYNNGWLQLNCHRFALDFLPVLILLVARGIRRCEPRIWKAAIGYSVALNILALCVIPLLKLTKFG